LQSRLLSEAELLPEQPIGQAKDERGKRYGSLVALYRADVSSLGVGDGAAWWVCRCDCGNYIVVRGYTLRNGDTTSCGCAKVVDITGQRFGHLVAIRFVGVRAHNAMWECRCDCGNTVVTRGGRLRAGATCVCRTGCDGRPEWVRERERVFKQYVDSANRRDIPFSLTLEQFGSLAQQPCHYCGAEPAGPPWPHNGLDRLSPDGGYSTDNVVPCCTACNYAKGTMEYAEFLGLVKRIYMRRAKD